MALFGKKEKTELALPEVLPEHVGFIMDGNGRWAKKRGLPRSLGHREGAKNFRKIVRHCKDIGLKTISFYAFSTENWKRSQDEVGALMNLFRDYLADVRNFLSENTRMVFLGDKSAFDPDIREKMEKLEADSAQYTEMTILMAVNYGGRDEIARAARILAEKAVKGEISPADIDEQAVSDNLYTTGYPDVDLLIRPSGEQRISNYLIWQCAYAEFYYTDILWPDFTPKELDKALIEYGNRNRRFGGV
ncbi:polyprenyl diphosphate synthase [Ruminococcus flavefaciens]|uniref:Isoprenyl transferase n=1 Tax=Ruminococcus flavefaciens 007c TaxID=1341157 RepID=W7UEP8_RUMFL|nr:polyprenyl diphosphate synthase [Ruminococcus flavefaciens]EWM53616.1 UDP pyrophosphate synthase [Ruminococcus flavefaciens 007c]